MIEVLKILAGKANGRASVVLTTMILIYLLGTAAVVNHFFVCVGLITFLCLLFLTITIFSKRQKDDTEKDKTG